MFDYSDLYFKLMSNVAIVSFIKKNGDIRVMLCTKNRTLGLEQNPNMESRYENMDFRNGLASGNMAVLDLESGKPKLFTLERVIGFTLFGSYSSISEIPKSVYTTLQEFRDKIEAGGAEENDN